MTPISAVVFFLGAALAAILFGALGWKFGVQRFDFTAWARFIVQRAWALLSDHRVWIVGIGVLAFFSSIGLLFVIPQQFQPTTNSDYSQVRYELPPGSTLEQSETIARQIGAILDNSPVVATAFYDINVRSEEHTSELQ